MLPTKGGILAADRTSTPIYPNSQNTENAAVMIPMITPTRYTCGLAVRNSPVQWMRTIAVSMCPRRQQNRTKQYRRVNIPKAAPSTMFPMMNPAAAMAANRRTLKPIKPQTMHFGQDLAKMTNPMERRIDKHIMPRQMPMNGPVVSGVKPGRVPGGGGVLVALEFTPGLFGGGNGAAEE